MMPKSSARFVIENARVTRKYVSPKGACFLTLFCHTGKFEQYLDVAAFDGVADKFGEGESVTVKGDVNLSKKKEGERFRQIQLIARVIAPGDESLTAALPAKREKADTGGVPQDDDGIPF
jgi:hypothetical protein